MSTRSGPSSSDTRTWRPKPGSASRSVCSTTAAATAVLKAVSETTRGPGSSSPEQPASRRSGTRQERARSRTAIGCPPPEAAGRSGRLARRDRQARAHRREDVVEPGAGLVLVETLRVHELAGEDLLRLHEHLLLARRKALLLVTKGQVADDLGQLEDVAGLHLVAVVLEAAVSVFLRLFGAPAPHVEKLLDPLFVDHPAGPHSLGVLRRDIDGHVVVQDLDRQVFPLLAEDRAGLLLHHLAGSVVRVDDLIANSEQALLLLHAQKKPLPTPAEPSHCSGNPHEQRFSAPFRPPGGLSAGDNALELQVTVDQVVLLQPAQPLANLAGTDGADAVDGLEVAMTRADDLVEAREVGEDLADDRVREPRNAREHAVAARRDRVVDRVRVPVIAEQLGELLELEQLVLRQRRELLEHACRGGRFPAHLVVVHDGHLVARDVLHELVELHADEPPLRSELDAVALDLLGHAGGHLGALENDEDVVEHDRALELERRQAGEPLLEALPVGLERPERLVRPREELRDLRELVAKLVDEDRHRLALLRDRDDERLRLLGDALGGTVPRPRLRRGDR